LNYITKTSELKKFLVDIHHAEFVGMDCEFMRRNTYYAIPSLIQLATKEQSAVIDLITLEDASALFEYLNSSESIFILHGAEQDFEIFADLSIKLKKFIDTQVALTISGHAMQTALEKALESELAIKIDKRMQTTDWSIRPLSREKIDYALSDTLHLIDLYQCLEKKTKKLRQF
jgi:ribonuclease D